MQRRLFYILAAAMTLFQSSVYAVEEEKVDVSGDDSILSEEKEGENFWDAWSIEGYNTVRQETYDTDGNSLASPYPFDGGQFYDEFDVNIARQFSPYKRFRASAFGVVNESDYRAENTGLVPERLNLFFENGEGAVPYRLEGGDYFAGTSYRTLQRTLKGASVELQPFRSNRRRHSVWLFSGTNQPTYRSFAPEDEYYNGASWLLEDSKWGQASFNAVHAYQDGPLGEPFDSNNSQMVYSAAFETPFELAAQRFTLESEVALFDGDYFTEDNQTDLGVLLELTSQGKELPFDYRLRYERYGEDYRPIGSIISSDRQSYEAHLGWRFEDGMALRSRLQRFEDSFESTNEMTTEVVGVNLSGPLFDETFEGLSGNFDVFRQSIEDDLASVDTVTDTLNAALSKPVYEDWTAQLGTFLQAAHDETAFNADSSIAQIDLNVTKPFSFDEFSGTVTPGIAVRKMNFKGNSNVVEVQPTIAFSIANDAHRLSANYSYLNQNSIYGFATDVATVTSGLDYSYNYDNHELGLSAAHYDRLADAEQDTDAYRVGVYWTVRFSKPAVDNGEEVPEIYLSGGSLTPEGLRSAMLGTIRDIVPGEMLSRAVTMLSENGMEKPSNRPGMKSYEARVIQDVVERQRLVVAYKGDKVEKIGLVVDVTNTGSPRSVAQLYEQIKETLVEQFGKPVTIFEQGEFGNNIVADINSERLIRVLEWKTPGGVLRYGIPRRLDGQIRIELQHAKKFSSPRNMLWSMGVN